MARDYDGYGFHVASCTFNNDGERNEAIELIKDMLRRENTYRLSKEYLDQYAQSQDSQWKTNVPSPSLVSSTTSLF